MIEGEGCIRAAQAHSTRILKLMNSSEDTKDTAYMPQQLEYKFSTKIPSFLGSYPNAQGKE
jgi:hypothetical protein